LLKKEKAMPETHAPDQKTRLKSGIFQLSDQNLNIILGIELALLFTQENRAEGAGEMQGAGKRGKGK
jgi:hypothetical protein